MKIVMFYHSLISDWNHGNAHFLRGIVTELLSRGHEVCVFEPECSWSLSNLIGEHGLTPVRRFHEVYSQLKSSFYNPESINLDEALDLADIVLVHEWNEATFVRRVGEHRSRNATYRLFFHDTHHRMVTHPQAMGAYDLSHYDGVLAYGKVLQQLYLSSGRARRAWTWHEAADTRVFHPLSNIPRSEPLVWIGNWGDGERTSELEEFFIQPVKTLQLKARAHGVRYPHEARAALAQAGIRYSGWLPNFEVPKVFARHKMTMHIPRRPYVDALPGIPTIRVFEALACGIPLICSPWNDVENLFAAGKDFLVAENGQQITTHLRLLLNEPDARRELSANGLERIRSRHTCAHRTDELLQIYSQIQPTQTSYAA